MALNPVNVSEVKPLDPEADFIKSAWENVVIHRREPGYPVRPIVLNSWIRCRNAEIDPFSHTPPPVIPKTELDRLLRRNRDLIDISKPVMRMIAISVRGTGFIVTLADSEVRVLDTAGDKEILELAETRKYIPGCQRDSATSGTNALALAMEEGRPVQLTGAEHYNVNYHTWTCSSAPIHDESNNVIGLITLSGRHTGRHKHTLALVTAAASAIETQIRELALMDEEHRLNAMVRRIHNSLADGFIAVDSAMEITHLNDTAVRMLGMQRARPFIGRRLEEIADLDDGILKSLQNRSKPDPTEIGFHCLGGNKTYLCRIDPIKTETNKLVGLIISMSEKRQMINMVKRLSGNYSKYEFKDIKGSNPALARQVQLARIAAATDSRVLLIGESGTGKELFAQAIHSDSNRSREPFVAISCAAIPRDLIESELFGYIGGAFTGARRTGMVGKFELANKGTLFLDEINGLPLELQAKLLRVLQQNEIMRLGDTQTLPVDVRIVAAGNTDLLDEVGRGNFREDLYYRLNVVEIFIPPLRERIDDLEMLLHYIMDRQCRKLGTGKPKISDEALRMLKDYDWPGNVRELENVCERALLFSQGGTIAVDHLPLRSCRDAGRYRFFL